MSYCYMGEDWRGIDQIFLWYNFVVARERHTSCPGWASSIPERVIIPAKLTPFHAGANALRPFRVAPRARRTEIQGEPWLLFL